MIDLREVRLLVVDGRSLSRAAMSAALDAEPDVDVVGAAATVPAALELAASEVPHVVLLEASLADGVTQHPCAALKARAPRSKVVVIGDRPEPGVLLAAVRAGADGYVTRDEPLDTVIDAVRRVSAGEARVPSRMLAGLLRDLSAQQQHSEAALALLMKLTRREKEVLELLVDGCDHEAVADILTISPQTARTHIQNIIGKLGVHSRLEAAALAVEHGLTGRTAAHRTR